MGTGWEGDFGDMWRVQSYEFFVGGFGTNDASISGDFQLQAICARIGTGALRRGETVAELKRRYAHDNREDQAEWRASSTSP